jgi:hypothetical protein
MRTPIARVKMAPKETSQATLRQVPILPVEGMKTRRESTLAVKSDRQTVVTSQHLGGTRQVPKAKVLARALRMRTSLCTPRTSIMLSS